MNEAREIHELHEIKTLDSKTVGKTFHQKVRAFLSRRNRTVPR